MSYIQQLIDYDKDVFLSINGSNSIFWDGFMWIYTSTIVWVPVFIVLLFVIIKNNKLKETLLIIGMVVLLVFLCDRISSGFFKPFFKRFRPSQDPEIMYLVDIVNGYRGGRYGFISSHAANSFGIAVFTSLLFKNRAYTLAILSWAVINSYSRIYLGVHYTGDVICAIILGSMLGYLIYLLYKYIYSKYFPRSIKKKQSVVYTSSGYLISDINIFLTTLFLTFFFIVIIGMIVYDFNYL